MEKPGCSLALTKVAAEEESKVDQNKISVGVLNNDELVGFQSDPSNFKEDGLVSGAGGSGESAMFPPEVWKVLLNDGVKSEDIHDVLFLTFPELDQPFQNKKALWLFDEVLPHLMTKHLVANKFKDLFTLRLVSKRWKASVDSSLVSHVALQHLPPPSQKDSKLMPSENHFNYDRLQDSKFGASIFRTDKQIDDFLTAMTNHSGNPFPGRYISITVSNSSVDKSFALFEKFGEHVLFLEIDLNGDYPCDLNLCQNVLKYLSHSPNLRSLTLTGKLHTSADLQTGDYFSKPEANDLFPDLPNLEAFNWQVKCHSFEPLMWTTKMIQKYAGKEGLGKLGISSKLYMIVPSSFTNITELNLIVKDKEFLEDAFKNLPNPHKLRKLCLEPEYGQTDMIPKLMNFLAGYKVESLNLEAFPVHDESLWSLPWHKNEKVAKVSAEAASITSLYLTDTLNLGSDIFKWLPNLQFLTITFHIDWIVKWGYEFNEGIKPYAKLADRIRGLVLKACDKTVNVTGNEEFSIWKELPQLKIFNAKVVRNGSAVSVWNLQFVRECGDKAFFFGSIPEVKMILHDDLDEEGADWGYDENEDYTMGHSFHG